MTIPIKKPYVFLRCKKCGRKTDHVMIDTSFLFRFGECQLEETYECQECGETKKIYEFTTSHVVSPIQHSVKQRSRKPQEKPEIPGKEKKDFIEVSIRRKKK